ncbi:hypothetical protein V1509DRAFT_613530, partial [Lipomyces kononenkoae]
LSFQHLSSLAALASCSKGNIPSELSVIGSPHLTLDAEFPQAGKSYVTFQPGQTLTSRETTNAPTFNAHSQPFTNASSLSSKYVFIMVDPSVNPTDPTYPALHTLYANVTSSNGNVNWNVVAPFINPLPDTVAPHDYTLLLFNQPKAQLVIPSKYSPYMPLNFSDPYPREAFPLLDFIHDTQLGEPVAGNWFREGLPSTNTSSSNAVSYPSGTDVVGNSTATDTATATATGITTTGQNTSTPTGTSPPVSGQAVIIDTSLRNVLLGISTVVVTLML